MKKFLGNAVPIAIVIGAFLLAVALAVREPAMPEADVTVAASTAAPLAPTPTLARAFDERFEIHLRFFRWNPTGFHLERFVRDSDLQVIWTDDLGTPAECDIGVIYLRKDIFDPRPYEQLLEDIAAGRKDWREHTDLLERFASAQAIIAHELWHQFVGDVMVATPTEGSAYRELAEQRAHIVELKVQVETFALFKGVRPDYSYPPVWDVYGDILPDDPYDVDTMLAGTHPADEAIARFIMTLPRPGGGQ